MNLITHKQQDNLLDELLKHYSQKREKNPAYSLRAFSKRIGVSSGALTEILNKKRSVTLNTAVKILKNLNFNDIEINSFLNDTKAQKSSRQFNDLAIDQYQILSSWHYLALLNLLELPSTKHNAKYLAKRLCLSENKIKESLERLLRLEMLEYIDGKYSRTHIRYKTTEDIANSAIKKYHSDTLELTEQSLREIGPDLRDFSSILLKMNTKNLKKIKEMIRSFQDEVSDTVDSDDPEEIYHLNVHLYPVTKNVNKNEV